MVFQFDSRVRYSEVDMQHRLTLNNIINYFQDCSTFQSESIGLGLEYLSRKNRAWILSSWQIEIQRFPKFGENIRVQTWAFGFKACLGERNFAILDEQGNYLVKANSLWVFLDTVTRHPARIAEHEVAAYGLEPPLEMEYLSRKIPLPKQAVEMESFQVRRQHLDTNHHVNNGQYVQMAQEYMPDGFSLHSMRAEYKKEAKLHDTIVPFVAMQDMECTVSLCDETGKSYAVIVFK